MQRMQLRRKYRAKARPAKIEVRRQHTANEVDGSGMAGYSLPRIGLSYALGAKVFGVPLYIKSDQGAQLKHAIEQRVFDAARPAVVTGSKFIGTHDARTKYRITDDGIALVSIQGVLIDRGPWLGDLGGIATSYEGLAEQFHRISSNAAITAVVLDIDSPGGMVAGVYDVAAELAKLGKAKPVYALAANMAASAAYAVACVAREVYVTRTGIVGAIGVIQIHQAYGRMLDEMGIDTTIICEPAAKAHANPYNALSHGSLAEMSARVETAYGQFVTHVAKNRALSEKAVRATAAKCFCGADAVKMGLADGVKNIREVLNHVRHQQKLNRTEAGSKASDSRNGVAAIPHSRAAPVRPSAQFSSPFDVSTFYARMAERMEERSK